MGVSANAVRYLKALGTNVYWVSQISAAPEADGRATMIKAKSGVAASLPHLIVSKSARGPGHVACTDEKRSLWSIASACSTHASMSGESSSRSA